MSNPLYTAMMNNNNQMGMNNFMQRFAQFRSQFQGDPKSQVQSLLDSGKVTQAQYDRAVQMANQMMGMFR